MSAPPNKTPPELVAKARSLWAKGFMRKFIAAETGLSERTVTRVCADIPKPYEHRGRKRWAAITRQKDME